MKMFFNKKTVVIAVVLLVVVSSLVFGAAASIINAQRTLYPSAQVTLVSAAMGTTNATATNTATFDYPMNNLSCDFISGPSATTANVSYKVQANQGSSTSIFDAASSFGVDTFTVAGSVSASTIATKTVLAAKPFRTIVATVTAPTTTQVITINCSATQ